jgi:hypothetical protein
MGAFYEALASPNASYYYDPLSSEGVVGSDEHIEQNPVAQTSCRRKEIMLAQKLMDHQPPSPSLKIHTFLDYKHLYSTWVADSFSFHAVE